MNTFEKKYILKNKLRNHMSFEKATRIISYLSKENAIEAITL